ncbi:MAG: tRNA (guanosine(46)-N7)-methyltransferase TrmB [Clostridia bacterium]|nr:tRNA (guanosine(46)-N7)-methyltransferase TrmB [Clostridia bacterium]
MRRKRNLEPRIEACKDVLLVRGAPCLNLKEAEENFRALIDFEKVFGNSNPVELEVGCGNGGFIKELATRERNTNFLCVEICDNVILTAMERILEEGIDNVRFLNIPAEILRCYLPEGSVRKIYLNFSTPLPEHSREKQRLTSPRFLKIYDSLLTAGGKILQKTDSEEFFDYSLNELQNFGFEIERVTRDLHNSESAATNIVTEYERGFLEQGKRIFALTAIKKN